MARKLSLFDLPTRLKRASTARARSATKQVSKPKTRPRRATADVSPCSSIPQLPPVFRESMNVHFDALEFLTLDPEPWVGVCVEGSKELDFGLPNFSLTRRESLRSLYSNSSQAYEADSSSRVNSSTADEDGDVTQSSYMSSSDDHMRMSSAPPSPVSPTLSTIAIPTSRSLASYYTHTYLPDFRKSVILADAKAPPRPPRRRPTLAVIDPGSPTTSLHRASSRAGSSKSTSAKSTPLLSRRLTSSSSSTSLRTSSHNGSMRSIIASSSKTSSTTDLRPNGYI